MSKCPFPVGYFRNIRTGQKEYASCKQWSCPVCGPRRKRELLDRVKLGFTTHEVPFIPAPGEKSEGIRLYDVRMLTLTLKAGTDDSLITKYWNTLRQELKDEGLEIKRFFWTKEFTKRGVRHLHVLIDRYIPKVVIKKLWRRITGGSYIVHITRMQLRNPAGYAAKYMTKGFLEGAFRKYERRFSCSRNFPPTTAKSSDGTWEFRWNPSLGFHVWKHSIYGQGFDTEDSWRDAWKAFEIPEKTPKRIHRKKIYSRPLPIPGVERLYLWHIAGLLSIITNIRLIGKLYLS